MSNKKLILGVAAGVAALAVVGVICKRRGYFDGLEERAEELGSNLKDKFGSLKETAKKKFDEVTKHGENAIAETADKAGNRMAGNDNINPATT